MDPSESIWKTLAILGRALIGAACGFFIGFLASLMLEGHRVGGSGGDLLTASWIGAGLGAIVAAGAGGRNVGGRRMETVLLGTLLGTLLGFGSLLIATSTDGLWGLDRGAVLVIGVATGAVLGTLGGRIRAGGRLAIWELAVGIVLAAFLCAVVAAWRTK